MHVGIHQWSKLLTAVALSAPLVVAGCASQEAPAEEPMGSEMAAPTQPIGGQELFGHYQIPEAFPNPLPDTDHSHDGWTWGSQAAVFAETPDKIWIVQRGELPLPEGADPWTPYIMLDPPRRGTGNTDGLNATCNPTGMRGWERRWLHTILVVDSQGNLVDNWPQHDALFAQLVDGQACGRGAHKVKISPYDPEKHVWIIDDQLHMIYKFTQDGELVHSKGEMGVRGRGPNTFDRPTDIAWLPDGTYFISDGYGGKRVAKYAPDDSFIMDWGSEPADPANPGPNEWNTVHSIAISADRRLFVVDRGHSRIQVFDEEGNFLFLFPTGPRGRSAPFAHEIFREGGPDGPEYIWAADGGSDRMLKFDLDGNYLYGWGRTGGRYGETTGAHSLSTDQNGNLYTAEVFGSRIQKFVPRPGADPAKIMGHQLRTWE